LINKLIVVLSEGESERIDDAILKTNKSGGFGTLVYRLPVALSWLPAVTETHLLPSDMNSLDILGVQALMRALEQIHSSLDLEVLPEALFSALEDLVPDAGCSLDQLDLQTGVVTDVTNANLAVPKQIKERVLELLPSHPVMPAYKAGRRGVIPVSDCITQRQFRDTPHYRETLRPAGFEYQVVITLDIPGKIAGMTVNRPTDFTEKELTLLRLVAPQIALAYRNALAFTELKQAAARAIPAPKDLQQIGLTGREGEVLHWVIQGKRDKEVAGILSTSPRTIHNHLRRILGKLNAETRTGAALEAFERLKGSSVS
jgi:DNA-binding CsgD family transcriptional regulator